jgi:Zn-dependent protease
MDLFTIISLFIGFIVGITVHESSHAWMGNKLGDSTAKDLGRISLNPIRHIDLIGTVVLPIVGLLSPAHAFFGWAKPTPYNPSNLEDGVKDEIFIAFAGPLSNILLAVLIYILWIVSSFVLALFSIEIPDSVNRFLYLVILENLILTFFNLLPIPPLDGSSVLKAILPKKSGSFLDFYSQYGFMILMLSAATPLGDLISAYVDHCVDFCLTIGGIY